MIMKRLMILSMMCFGLFSLSAQQKSGFRSVGVDEFASAVADSAVVVLDVRTPEEYAEGHIPGTDFNIDVLEESYKEKVLESVPAGSSVALYCRSGNRSKNAARILSSSGYKVVELSTGFRGWVASGRPVEK